MAYLDVKRGLHAKNGNTIHKMKTTAASLLLEHYLEYQRKVGRLLTQKDFAEEYLKIHEVTFNHLMNGRRKFTDKMAIHCYKITGDDRFLALNRLPTPNNDEAINYVVINWDRLQDGERKAVRDQVAEYITKRKPKK